MNDNPRTIRPMKCSGSDEHDEMQLVMKSGEVLESKSVWHPIKCSHSGISCGTMYGQSCIGQFRSLKTVRQSNFRIDSDAFVRVRGPHPRTSSTCFPLRCGEHKTRKDAHQTSQ